MPTMFDLSLQLRGDSLRPQVTQATAQTKPHAHDAKPAGSPTIPKKNVQQKGKTPHNTIRGINTKDLDHSQHHHNNDCIQTTSASA